MTSPSNTPLADLLSESLTATTKKKEHNRMEVVIASKGSKFGNSHYGRYRNNPCMRRIKLNKEYNETTGETYSEVGEGAYRGTLFHKFQEMYHTGRVFDPRDVEFVNIITDPATGEVTKRPAREATPTALHEAIACHQFWKQNFGRSSLGEVIAAELSLGYGAPDDTYVRSVLRDALGHDEYSGDLDLVVDVKDPESFARAFENAGIPIARDIEPGIWIIDWKCPKDGGNAFKYESGDQEIGYPWLWSIAAPDHEMPKGMMYIVVAPGRKKVPTPTVDLVIHEAPNEEQISYLIRQINIGKTMKETLLKLDDDAPNRSRCAPEFSTNEWCQYYLSGMCKRY